jgi:nucleolar pre-ribosomal-associated protein 1
MRESEILEAAKKPKLDQGVTVRTCAIKFLLALVAHGNTATKESVLENKDLVNALIKFLPLDSDETIQAVLQTLTDDILFNKKISRSAKISFFGNLHLLTKVASLYSRRYDHPQESTNTTDAVHRFLLNTCTRPGIGICFQDRGWYGRLDLTGQEQSHLYNYTLERFVTQLKPAENESQRSLLLNILETCPELRAPYFSAIQNPGDSSLTLATICAVNLWQEIIRLPLPNNLNEADNLYHESPPSTTVRDNVMPPFLTKSYLTGGLNQQSPLVRFTFASLILAILEKLKELKQIYVLGGWQLSFDNILENISRRLPDASTLVTLHSNSRDHRLIGHCSIKVLSLYGELLSPVANNHKIDAKALTSAFQTEWNFATPMDLLEGIHLLEIVRDQSEVNWWSRQGIHPQIRLTFQALVNHSSPF